jgi:anion-transporting  ArsA/GET3 family ATPase
MNEPSGLPRPDAGVRRRLHCAQSAIDDIFGAFRRPRDATIVAGRARGRVVEREGGETMNAFVVAAFGLAAFAEGDVVSSRLVARRRRFETMRAALGDPAVTGFVLVLVRERLPLRESEKARALLRRFGIEVAGAVVDRVLPDDAEGAFLATRRERERAYLDDIDRSFQDLPRPRVPLAADDVVGLDALGRLAEAWG